MPDFIYNTCPLCKNKEYSVIGYSDLGEVEIEKPTESLIVKCQFCKTIYTNPLPVWTKNDFDILYKDPENYFVVDDKWLQIRENDIVKRRAEEIAKHILTDKKNMLEVGAGISAYMIKYLVKQGWEAMAQEPSLEYSEVLKNAIPSLQVSNDSFLDMKTDEKYSLIYIDSVLEHVVNPTEYLKKAINLLDEGGILYFISPNEYSFKNWARTMINKLRGKYVTYLCPYTMSYHLIGFSKKGINIMAQQSGLELLKIIRGHDYEWYHLINSKKSFTKYFIAPLLYLMDLVGLGTNQEVMLRKPKKK